VAQPPDRQAELTQIGRDANTYSVNHGATDRLQNEVTQYMASFKNPEDGAALTTKLREAGMRDDDVAKLEKYGFSSFHDVMSEVNQVEGKYNQTAATDQQSAERSLSAALTDVRTFCQNHPDQAADMISKLDENKLLPQLAMAALNDAVKNREQATGKPVESLNRQEALALLGQDKSPLGQALAADMNRSFSIQQADGTTPSGYWGRGYADTSRLKSTGSEPAISRYHLQDLMQRFNRQPLGPNEEVQLDPTPPNRLMKFIRDYL